MTLAEGKRKVLMLLDEYSSGGEITQDIDINNKMADFFDMAQKDMAIVQPVLARVDITLDSNEKYTDLPAGFLRYYKVYKGDDEIRRYPIKKGKMYTNNDSGTITVEYIKEPSTITPETNDNYVFEVNESAATILPFYVASQQLITDLVVDYSALWQMYLMQKEKLPCSIPETGGMVVQNFFGGR